MCYESNDASLLVFIGSIEILWITHSLLFVVTVTLPIKSIYSLN